MNLRPLLPLILLAGCAGNSPICVDGSSDCADGGSGGEAASFATEVVPLFATEGCAAAACHDAITTQGDMNLEGAGTGPTCDPLHATVIIRVNTSDPESSMLLLRPQGFDDHPGGELIVEGDTTYTTWLSWIQGGADNDCP